LTSPFVFNRRPHCSISHCNPKFPSLTAKLEPLCDALERLAVERIRLRPEKYQGLGKNEEVIEDIEIKNFG
jgi:hypothetical protein